MRRWALILLLLGAVALIILLTDDKPRMTIGQSEPCCDSDGDGFSDGFETYLGTSPLTACLRADVDPSVRGWPVDLNNDGVSDITDIATLTAHFGETIWGYHGLEYQRYDISGEPMGDGVIDVSDIVRAGAFFGQTCG